MLSTTNKPKCDANRLDGYSCNAYALTDSKYCFEHEPSLAAKRTEAKSKGGRKRAYVAGMQVSINSIEDVLDGISEVIGNLKVMDCTVSQARALVDAYLAALKVFELKELEVRLIKIEEMMEDKYE